MQTALIPAVIAAAVIAALLVLLASTGKSQTGHAPPSSAGKAWEDGKYASGYCMTIGIAPVY